MILISYLIHSAWKDSELTGYQMPLAQKEAA